MILIKQTLNTKVYAVGDQKVTYYRDRDYARYLNEAGKDTKRRKLPGESEEEFIKGIFKSLVDKKKNSGLQNIIKAFFVKRQGNISYRTYQEDKILLSAAYKLFKNVDFSDTKVKLINDILDCADISNDKRNRIQKKMQQLVDFAIAEDLFPVNHNVFKSIKTVSVPKSEKKKKAFFEMPSDVPHEHHTIQRLYEVAETPQQRILILLCTITGARINELMSLTWDDLIVKNKQNPILKIRNSKVKPTDTNLDDYRYVDINLHNYEKLQSLRYAMEQSFKDRDIHLHQNTTEPLTSRLADRRDEVRGKFMITTLDGYKPSYTTLRMWYMNMWTRAYDKYINHEQYPFLHDRNPAGLTFHAFRRHFICSMRESIPNFSLTHHEQLQQLVGHVVGSKVTDTTYTQWKASKVTDAKLNSKIDLGVNF